MDFNVSPYYDDYDEDKKFLRVLFRPGYSVQARELTQAQTILQKQVSRLGDFVFKNKSRVIPGELKRLSKYSLKLQPTEVDTGVNLDTFLAAVSNIQAVGETTGVKATIIFGEASTTAGDPPTIFVDYVSAGKNGETSFSQNEILSFTVLPITVTTVVDGVETSTTSSPTYTDQRTGAVTTVSPGSYRVRIQNVSDYENSGSIAVISEGIFYVNGNFVKVDAQRISISKYTNTPTANVGLDIVETIVTPEMDTSLLDNAAGTPNYTAPGAHRYKINLVLEKIDVGYAAENFIHLITLKDGVLQFEANSSSFSELETALARRTYDGAGDYTVRPFELEVKEHRNSDQGVWYGITNYQEGDVVYYVDTTTNTTNYYVCLDNGVSGTSPPVHTSGSASDGGVHWRYTKVPKYDYGVYTQENGGDTNKIAFGVKNGKAYVKGFEYETNGVRYVAADKARDFARITNTSVPTDLGNLIDVIMWGTPDVANCQIVDLYKVDTPQTAAQSTAVLTASQDSYGVVTSYNTYTAAKLNYVLVNYQYSATSQHDWIVAKMKADGNTTTTFPLGMNTWNAYNGTSNAWAPFNTTTRIGTARLRYVESGSLVNGKATAKISLMDVQMDAGQSFSKVRVIGTPLSLGSTGNGADPNCFRAMVIPTLYNSSSIGQATVATSGNYNTDMTGLGTRWLSSSNVSPGDFVWFPSSPTQWFMVRDLQGSDRTMKVTNFGTYNISGPLYRSDCVLQNPQDGDSLYPMTKTDLYTIRGGDDLNVNNTTYTVLQKFAATGDSGSTYVSLSFSANDPDQLYITDPTAYIVIDNVTGEMLTPYDVTLNTSQQATIRLIDQSTRAVSISALQGDSFTIYAPVLRRLTSSKEKTKSLFTQTQEIIIQSGVEQDTIKLNKADIYRVLKIEMFPNVVFGNDISTILSGTGIDITSNYTVDNGQRDTHYDLGRIVKGKAVPYPTGPIRITYEYFSHTAGDYFSVDSYPDLLYDEIPTYFSSTLGKTYSLKDVLDFRPRVNDAGTFTGGSVSLSNLPQRKYNFQCDFAYYLPRKDKIVLNRQGAFVVIKGVSAENPQLPAAPADTMELYDIEYKPYTYNTNSTNVIVKPIDNRGFTMREIAKIEKRVSNLEKQTALNSLERSTASLTIKDADGLDRFKNGFAVDNFSGHSVGDVNNVDYECSIDIINRVLRPSFNTVGVNLVETANTTVARNASGYRMHGEGIATLPYYTGPEYFYKNKNEIQSIIAKGTSATAAELSRKEALIRENNDLVLVEQPYATETVPITSTNGAFSGTITLYPTTDTWVETNVPSELVINEGGTYDSVAAQADALGIDFGTIWNQWQIASLGTPITTQSSTSWSADGGTYTATTTVVTQQVNQRSYGKDYSLNESVGLTNISGRLTARQSISYIRSRPTAFVATGLKAGVRMYAFCDEVNVTDYCTQATRLYLATRPYSYSYIPYQFGASSTERQVFLTFNTDDIFAADTSNYERSFSGSLAYDVGTYNSAFTTIYNGSSSQSTTITQSTILSDVAKGIIPKNTEVDCFQKGEVIRGEKSGATAIVVMHEQSTNGTTGQPDGVIDTLHVLNVRGTFQASENIIGTVMRTELGGKVLTLQLRASTPYEIASPGVLVTTGTGRIAGTWLITSGQVINNKASPKFLSGNRVFSLQDTTTNLPSTPGRVSRTSYADTVYSAVGIIDAGGSSTVGIRNATLGAADVTRDRSYIQTLSVNTNTTYVADPPPPASSTDPLAQTFIVSTSSMDATEGSFITGVELFFSDKDPVVPVAVELRTTTSGHPTTTVLPFGRKTLYPHDVLTSPKGDLGTFFRFPAPVYVKDSTMYSVSVMTPSTAYKLWTATLGGTDKSSAGLGSVLKNTNTGSLFKSQNSTSWQESPNQSLKLVVHRAIFNTIATSTQNNYITLKSQDIQQASNAGRTTAYTKLAVNPFRVSVGKSEIIVKVPNHGMSVGSVISFQNVSGADQYGFTNKQFNTETFTDTQFDIKTQTKITTGNAVKHTVFKVYSHDIFSIRVYDSANAAILATATGQFGGQNIIASICAPFTIMHPAINILNFQSTKVTGQIKTTSGRSVTGNETPFIKDTVWSDITLNDNNLFRSQRVILNKQNEIDKLSGESSIDLRLQLSSSNRFLSPMVDLQRATAVVTQNRIDDPVSTKNINGNYYSATGNYDGTEILFSEYENKQGGAQMGYITRKLQFANSSKLLKIQLAASIPSNCAIDKTTPTVSLPMKFKSGSFVSEHPSVYIQRSKQTTAYPIGTTAIILQSVTNLVDGMYVYGPGIQTGTRINGINTLTITLDKATKAAIPSTTNGTLYYFSAFDITQQDKTKQIDVGDYVTTTVSNAIPSGTYVTQAPKQSYFTKRVGSYATGSFVVASADAPIALYNSTIGGIDPSTNNMTFYLDDITGIKQGMYCYIRFYNSNDGTYTFGPATIRKVLRINSDSKSITVQPLDTSIVDEWSTTGYGAFFYFNGNNNQVTFFNPVVKLNNATTAAIDPSFTTRTSTNLTTFTSPANAEVEIYAKITNSGNTTVATTNSCQSNEYNASTNPYGVDSTNDIIYFPVPHNLTTGSQVLYNAQANAIGNLVNGNTYYVVYVSPNSIKLANDSTSATQIANGTVGYSPINISATSVQETHTFTDINLKAVTNIDDNMYFRILPDTTVGGDSSTYGGNYPLATGKGSLTYSDDPTKFIDHSFTVDNLPPFNTAIIKITMRSRNPAYVPQIKDLRVIATA